MSYSAKITQNFLIFGCYSIPQQEMVILSLKDMSFVKFETRNTILLQSIGETENILL
jgi:hypothetical protein